MKNGKNPTNKEKQLIESYSLNPRNWLIFKKADGQLHLIHRNTFYKRVIPNS